MSEQTTPDQAVAAPDNTDAAGSAPLTDEEHAALAAHEAGCSNRVIADEVGVSPTTIASMVKAAS